MNTEYREVRILMSPKTHAWVKDYAEDAGISPGDVIAHALALMISVEQIDPEDLVSIMGILERGRDRHLAAARKAGCA